MPHQTLGYHVNKDTIDFDYVTLSSPIFRSSTCTSETSQSFISLRCKPGLFTLPPELLFKVASTLSLHEYSYLSRTCSRFHRQLFHPAEMVQFLKKRYRLSIESGSIIIFAYLANMQIRAPLVLERIFEEFFADSPLRLQEEEQRRHLLQKQSQLLNQNTLELNQLITGGENGSNSNNTSFQLMDSLQAHKAAEKSRRQAKWDAIRMLGVLYALDKTHVGPSSTSTSALVLSGASDIVEQPAPSDTFSNPTSKSGDSQSTMIPLSVTTTSSTAGLCSSNDIETQQNKLLVPPDSFQQKFTQLGALGSLGHRQLVVRRNRRSLSQEGYDFQSTSSSVEADIGFRSLSHKRSLRNRQSPLLGSREDTTTMQSTSSCGNHRPDRPLGQSSHVDGMNTSSYLSLPSASTPSSSSSSSSSAFTSSSQETASMNVDPIDYFNIQMAPSNHSSKRFTRQHPTGSLIDDETMSEREWEELAYQQEQQKWDANSSDLLMCDPLENMNELDYCQSDGILESGGASECNNLSFGTATTSEDCLLSRNSWEEQSRLCSKFEHQKIKSPESRDSSSFLESSPSSRFSVPITQISNSRIQSTATFMNVEGNDWQNEQHQPRQHQPILNRSDKIAFLTRYTDRMHRKLQALEIKDWRNEDIQRKKTYQLMIQHNDKTGEKDLVDFYLGRYGGSVQPNQERLEQQGQQHSVAAVAAATAAAIAI
ncbi:hypothetical protein BGZ49_008377 [Haplosporangium sp. Z 27]|nr:hypothetical protein BGZ49_008377 [Haplosporangium sp. Z 27]